MRHLLVGLNLEENTHHNRRQKEEQPSLNGQLKDLLLVINNQRVT